MIGSSWRRPTRRLTAKKVRSGLVTAWRLAGWPTRRSPSSLKATIDGVVRIPSAFSMTFAVLPSITATHELVVPRSIPMTFPMVLISFFLRQVGWALTAHLTEPPTINYSRYCDGEPHIGGGAGAARTGAQYRTAKTGPHARSYRRMGALTRIAAKPGWAARNEGLTKECDPRDGLLPGRQSG